MTWKKGQSGNPNGRPINPDITKLREALEQVEADQGTSLFEHFCKRALRNDQVLIAFIKKFVPDMQFIEGKGFDTTHITVIKDMIQNVAEHRRSRVVPNRVEGES